MHNPATGGRTTKWPHFALFINIQQPLGHRRIYCPPQIHSQLTYKEDQTRLGKANIFPPSTADKPLWPPLPRVQEKNNCPLTFYLRLNLSTRLRKSNFDYFATKCYSGQLSVLCPWNGHSMDNCPLYGQLSIAFCREIIKIEFTQSRGQIQSQIKS